MKMKGSPSERGCLCTPSQISLDTGAYMEYNIDIFTRFITLHGREPNEALTFNREFAFAGEVSGFLLFRGFPAQKG